MDLKSRLRRTDWLRELSGLLVFAIVLVAAGVAITVGLAIRGPLVTDVPSDHVITADALTGLRAGARLDPDGLLDIRVDDPTARQATLAVLATAPTGLVVLAMLAMLLAVVRHARRHDPFTAATVRRLRLLGAVVIVGGVLAWAVEFIAGAGIVATVTQAGYGGTVSPLVPVMWTLVGFGYLAVAEIVNRGRAMRAELAEVI